MQRVVNSSSSCWRFSEYFTSQLRLYAPQDACVSIRGIMKVLGGFIFGFTVAFLLRRWRMSFVKDVRPRTVMQELGSRQLLFIGVMSVMTAKKFRNSRPRQCLRPGAKLFLENCSFSLAAFHRRWVYPWWVYRGLTIRILHRENPWWCWNICTITTSNISFDWFMRSDDDVHIRTEKLASFLHSLNSSQDIYLGQMAIGKKVKKRLLGLGKREKLCLI